MRHRQIKYNKGHHSIKTFKFIEGTFENGLMTYDVIWVLLFSSCIPIISEIVALLNAIARKSNTICIPGKSWHLKGGLALIYSNLIKDLEDNSFWFKFHCFFTLILSRSISIQLYCRRLLRAKQQEHILNEKDENFKRSFNDPIAVCLSGWIVFLRVRVRINSFGLFEGSFILFCRQIEFWSLKSIRAISNKRKRSTPSWLTYEKM